MSPDHPGGEVGEALVQGVTIHARAVVAEGDREGVWSTYLAAFEPLRSIAMQRHLMTRDELDAVLDDVRVTKYVAVDEAGAVVGLGTLTNDIASMPLVEPAFFASRWPEHWAAGRCYYIGFVAAHPDLQGTTLFTELIQLMSYTASLTGGVAVLDVCRHHVDRYALPEAIGRITSAVVPAVHVEQVDAQTYWAYESPVPVTPPDAVIELRDGAVSLPPSAFATDATKAAGRP